MFATASAPPNETRFGHSQILSSSSDARLPLQMSPGMDVIPWHPPMLRERREGSSQGSSRARAVGLGEEDVDGARWGGSPARRLRRRAAGRRRASSSGIDPI